MWQYALETRHDLYGFLENYFPIPVEMLPNKEIFMLKVKGDSMIDAGIYNGDRVVYSF